jgi:nitric oxide reductase large subunit
MGELIVPILMLLIGAVFAGESVFLKPQPEYPLESASYPRFLSGLLIALAVVILIRFIFKRRDYIEAERQRVFDPRVFLVLGLLVLFFFGVQLIGYVASAFLFVAVLSLFYQRGRPRVLDTLVLPAGLSIGLYYAFRFMGIYLPTGKLFAGIF